MKALITGVTGQDGYYLSKFLLEKGYEVHGTVRRSSNFNTTRIDGLIGQYSDSKQYQLHFSNLLDASSLTGLISQINPNEIYNLAAQSHVAVSFLNPSYSISTSTEGVTTILEAIKNVNSDIKYYQASSSEMFGGRDQELLNEDSLLDPKSPYAAAKVFAYNMTKLYRDSYGLFCTNGILFNHESPLRGETFVTRKITRAVGRIKNDLQRKLSLGNLSATRDWGYAGDYVEGMWKMLQHETPDDFILSTGESFSVKDFAKEAFQLVDLDWEEYVVTNKDYLRPNEVHHLRGDYTKAKNILNWEPRTDFKSLVKVMVESDLLLAEKEKVLIENKMLVPTWEYPN